MVEYDWLEVELAYEDVILTIIISYQFITIKMESS